MKMKNIRKKIVSTTLAAIISVSSFAGTIGNVSADNTPTATYSFKMVYGGLPYDQIYIDDCGFVNMYKDKDGNWDSKNWDFIYAKTQTGTGRYHINLLVVPKRNTDPILFYYDTMRSKTNKYTFENRDIQTQAFSYDIYKNNKGKWELVKGSMKNTGPYRMTLDKGHNYEVGPSSKINILGDVNNDKNIDVADITKIAAHIKGKKILSAFERKVADVKPALAASGEQDINVTDIELIAAHIKGKKRII
jgi:hypothetical protein